jgi:hypothetical protein
VKGSKEWDFRSLAWLHDAREAHYRATRGLPLEGWLKPVDSDKAAEACRRLGLKVRVDRGLRRKRARMG